jgi:hypothetical protein
MRRSPSKSSFSRSRSDLRVVAAAAATLVTLVAVPAEAIERQHHLGLAPALAILSIDKKSTNSVGAGGAIHYAYGLTDQFNLVVEASSAVVAAKQKQDFPYSPKNRPATVDQLSAGVSYVIDIVQWVPYLGLQGGVYRLAGGTVPDSLFIPGIAVSLGIDYQLSRHVAVGIGGRQHLLLTKLDTYPSYTTVLLRFEYMWGY